MLDSALDVKAIAGVAPLPPAHAYDLAAIGYVEREFLVGGTATSYRLTGERTPDGRWSAEPDGTAPFRTRVIVRQPQDATRFSGTVLVEWLNVSAGLDSSPDWDFVHRHAFRRGHAWMGVSVQRAGIDGDAVVPGMPTMNLKSAAPDRYADLEHPGDEYAYDIFTLAGRLARSGGEVLAGVAPERLLAMGESQSAMFLTTYVNAVDPAVAVYDGFLIHGRPGQAAPIDGMRRAGGAELRESLSALGGQQGELVRDDARVPVLVLQSETDVVLLGGVAARQPDGDRIRLWEIAGASHADTYLLNASRRDDGTADPGELAALLQPISEVVGVPTDKPINAGPQQHYVAQAAIEHLDRWAAGGAPPPTAPRLELDGTGGEFRRDALGIAAGGIRTPWVDVPLHALSGLGQSGAVFSILFGTTTPLDAATIARLYPGGREDYVARFTEQLDAAIAAGHILPEDRDEILAIASASFDAAA